MTTSLTTTHTQHLFSFFKENSWCTAVYLNLEICRRVSQMCIIILSAFCVSYNMVGNMKLYNIVAQGGQQSPHSAVAPVQFL